LIARDLPLKFEQIQTPMIPMNASMLAPDKKLGVAD